MRQAQSITKQFYRDVPVITGNENETPCLGVEEFASVSMEAVYVLDFFKRGFHFVASRDFFLCGHSVEEALSLGYDFFSKVIHKDDLPLLADIHATVLIRLCSTKESRRVNYFSFAVRIKNEAGYLMVYHKLKPVFVGGYIRYGLCLLSSSVLDTPGHLRACYDESTDFDEYSTHRRRWQKNTAQQPFSEREKNILKLVKQGKRNSEIAGNRNISRKPGILPISADTLRNDLASIYKKLNVSTMMQAVIHATNLHLIYSRGCNSAKQEKEEAPERKKCRRPITPEKRPRIQERLHKGQSIRSIARQENVSECAIRYQIKTGNLAKPIR